MKPRIAVPLLLAFTLAFATTGCATVSPVVTVLASVVSSVDRVLSAARIVWEQVKPYLGPDAEQVVKTYTERMLAVERAAAKMNKAVRAARRGEPVEDVEGLIRDTRLAAEALADLLRDLSVIKPSCVGTCAASLNPGAAKSAGTAMADLDIAVKEIQ